jgi:hypothetical protein
MINSVAEIVSLTGTGQTQFGLVKAPDRRTPASVDGWISPDEYQATIGVLSRMAANLESE